MPIFTIEYTTREIVHEYRVANVQAESEEEAIKYVKDDPYEWDVEDSDYVNYDRDDFLTIEGVLSDSAKNIIPNCNVKDILYQGLKDYIEKYGTDNNRRVYSVHEMAYLDSRNAEFWKDVNEGYYDKRFEHKKEIVRI